MNLINDNDIKVIDSKIEGMARLVQTQIHNSLMALKNSSIDEINKINEIEKVIDAYQKEIEELCIVYIATKQPVAKDLRRVFTSSKIVTDLERIADYAIDICRINKKIMGSIKDMENLMRPLWEMEIIVHNMISQSVQSYIFEDIDKAYEICKMDDVVDDIYGLFFEDIIKNIIKDTENSNSQAQLLFVAKYIERIGDHVTNICEWTIYSSTGEYVDLNE